MFAADFPEMGLYQKTMEIVLATHNKYKVEEIRSALGGISISWLTLNDFPHIGEIEETGATLLENSLLKASTVNANTGFPAVADDTGLEVDFLNGAPGIYSARWAGEKATFEDNVNKLLKELKDVPPAKRTARFRSVISFVDGKTEEWVEGTVKGRITEKSRGSEGFGYDPVFLIPDLGKTFAELSLEGKNTISHRGMAVKKLRQLLNELLDLQPQKKEEPIAQTLSCDQLR